MDRFFFYFYWRLGIDGLSIGPILLTGFINTLATLAAWPVTRDSRLFHFLMLAMYSGQIGLFSSRDLLLFFIMWELELIPVYLLISVWGGRNACIQLQSLFCTLREAPFFYYWEFWVSVYMLPMNQH